MVYVSKNKEKALGLPFWAKNQNNIQCDTVTLFWVTHFHFKISLNDRFTTSQETNKKGQLFSITIKNREFSYPIFDNYEVF